MKRITDEDIAQSIALYKWIAPRINPAPQLWNKGDEIRTHTIYKYVVNGKIQGFWADLENLQEPHFVRIYKKINILPHEFFLYHFGKVTRIGWRLKK